MIETKRAIVLMFITFLLGMVCMGFLQDVLEIESISNHPTVLAPAETPANCSQQIVYLESEPEVEFVPVYKDNLKYEVNTDHDPHCGWYDPNTRTATLYFDRTETLEKSLACFYHEFGHDVWNDKLTSGDRYKWLRQFESETEFVSEYAKTNVKEYFAESWRE